MKVIIDNIMEHYNNGMTITDEGSHYAYNYEGTLNDIIINLSQVQIHADMGKISLEHIFIQHVAHETIHKIIYNEEGEFACVDFDNIAREKAFKECGKIAFDKWFSGFYEGVKQ